MKRTLVTLAMLLALVVRTSAVADTVYVPLVRAATPTPEGVFVRSYSFDHYGPYVDIWGEIENRTGDAVYSVWVDAVFYDAAGAPVGVGRATTDIGALFPGERFPFDMYPQPMGTWMRVECEVTYSGEPLYGRTFTHALPIRDITAYVDSGGRTHAFGWVQNPTGQTWTLPQVFLTLYDGLGRVVYAEWTYTDDVLLGPGEESLFTFEAYAPGWTSSAVVVEAFAE